MDELGYRVLRTIGLCLIWLVAALLIKFSLSIILMGMALITLTSMSGFFFKYTGAATGLALVWGLAVFLVGAPSYNQVKDIEVSVDTAELQAITEDVREVAGDVWTGVKDDAANTSLDNKLSQLKKAYEDGHLTEEEYEAMRADVKAKFLTPSP